MRRLHTGYTDSPAVGEVAKTYASDRLGHCREKQPHSVYNGRRSAYDGKGVRMMYGGQGVRMAWQGVRVARTNSIV